MKGKQIDAWFREIENRRICNLPEIPEESIDKAIRVIMNAILDSNLAHTAMKRDNTRRIFTERSPTWDKKYICSWDYDGPEVGNSIHCLIS